LSFSAATKNELARVYSRSPCCRLAELAAILRMNGRFSRERLKAREDDGLRITTENAAVARKVLSLLKSHGDIRGEALVQRNVRLRKNNVYLLHISSQPGVRELLARLGTMGAKHGLPKQLLKKECCRRAYLRGVFLGAGSVNNPEGAYHLELSCEDRILGEEICRLMCKMDLPAKISERKSKQIIYLKGSEEIVRFLSIVGAHEALLSFENTRIYKDMRNQVNRLVNCETANLHKTVNASVRQLENIKLISEALGFDQMPPSLRVVAELRAQHPDACLQELGKLVEPPLSKSGINHRMRKIEELADNIRLYGI
jgi:DNA-binding protein WhiA